jgi:hypothetical protein
MKPNRRTQHRLDDVIAELKLVLFAIASPDALETVDRYCRAQHATYGHLGLRYVPAADMARAVDELLGRLGLAPGQRLIEIGPGPHGGLGLVAALLGLDVVMVETDRPFAFDVDALKQHLAGVPTSAATLAQISHLSGRMEVNPVDSLTKVLSPYPDLVAAAGGSIQVVLGDFSDPAVQARVSALPPFDHVVCTDAINPTNAMSTTTAATTTGDPGPVQSMVQGLARLASRARTLSVSVVIPEENGEFRDRIAGLYRALEEELQRQGRATRYERAICPSSSAILRARLYHLGDAPQGAPRYSQPMWEPE